MAFQIAVQTGTADETGAAVLDGPQAEPGVVHVISRVKVSATSAALGTVMLYESDESDARYIDGSQTAADDTWEGTLVMPSGEHLHVVFSDLDALAPVRARIYYQAIGRQPDDTFSAMTR